jgi:hypothetical protein
MASQALNDSRRTQVVEHELMLHGEDLRKLTKNIKKAFLEGPQQEGLLEIGGRCL